MFGEYIVEVSKLVTYGISSTRVQVALSKDKDKKTFQLNKTLRHGQVAADEQSFQSFVEIFDMIARLCFPNMSLSIGIFERLAIAEGKIHNRPVDQVHFHEVGAVDSIVDIVGAAICIDYLKPDRIIASPVKVGSGMVSCMHGTYPVPAPATAELLQHIPITLGKVPFEATTPTGAAILSTVVDEFQEKISFTPNKVGYGAGTRDSEIPNVFRVVHGEVENENHNVFGHEQAMIIECNIDDMNPELNEHVVNRLFEAGAQDVFITPILMKKMRSAQKISVLCSRDTFDAMTKILMQETTTLGVRSYCVDKWLLQREMVVIETSLGKVRVKKSYGSSIVKFKPEYDDCLEIARKQNRSLPEVIQLIQQEVAAKFSGLS